MTDICPCCKRPFAPALAVGGRIRQQIVDILGRRPDGVACNDLAGMIYADDPNGGPDYAQGTIRQHVYHCNKRLAAHGYTIQADHRGSGARYKLVELRAPGP